MAPVFRAEALSKLLRTDGADWFAGIVGAVGTTVLLHLAVPRGSPFDLIPLGMSLLCGLCGWLGVWSWRRLWRIGRTRFERAVYDHGVRGWGAAMLITMPVLVVAILWGVSGTLNWRLVLACIFTVMFVVFSLCLWSGHAFGWVIAGTLPKLSGDIAGNKQDGLPPPL